jgi:hypothetical protein
MPQFSGIWTLGQVSQAVKAQNWTGIAPPVVEYLVVAGGGAGNYTGGGGAGGLLSGFSGVSIGSSITVTVGAGGTGTLGTSQGTAGSNSVFSSITAIGGGLGVQNYSNVGSTNNGGSGGGGNGAITISGTWYAGANGVNGLGGGGGGGSAYPNYGGIGGNGGSGVVIIRYLYSSAIITSNSNSTSTALGTSLSSLRYLIMIGVFVGPTLIRGFRPLIQSFPSNSNIAEILYVSVCLIVTL